MSQLALNSSLSRGPSMMRYKRVQSVLESEPALQEKLGPKDQEVPKKNGEVERYSKEVVEITMRLYSKGIEANTVDKAVIINTAVDVLRLLKSNAKKTETKGTGEATSAELQEVRSKTEETQAVETQAVETQAVETQPAESQTTVAPIKRRRRRKKSELSGQNGEPSSEVSLASEPTASNSQPLTHESSASPDPEENGQTVPATYPFVAVLSLLHSAYNLLKLFDREPGSEKRQEKVSDLIDEMYRLKNVPVLAPMDTLPPSLKHGITNTK